MSRLHRNLIDAIHEVVQRCIVEGASADKLIEKKLKENTKWGSRDRSFIAETSYEIIRYYRLYEFLIVPDTDVYKIIGSYFILKGIPLPAWDIFSNLEAERVQQKYHEAKSQFNVIQSYPDALVQIVQKEIPLSWQDELLALNEKSKLILRVNTLCTTKSALVETLSKQGHEMKSINGIPEALVATQRWNVFADPLFKQGCFELQDASSQLVAAFAEVKPGMRVIDACAGAGGKSLHLAALMQNKGRILSMDIEEWKLEELRRRARRAGIQIIETRHITGTKVVKRLANSCDRLLLDVPCSGLGVLRRNPDAKWKIDSGFIERMIDTQKSILHSYSSMVRQGGKLIYATCSILPSENSKQISYFCAEHPHFQLEEEKHISPALSGFDGFYMARLIRH